MDPLTLLTILGSGLGLVDKFYDLAVKVQGGKPGQHRVNVKPQQNMMVIVEDGYEQEVRADQLNLGEFDKVRNDTLRRRIEINWTRYNGLDEQRALASADQEVLLKVQMDDLKRKLCPDFKELVTMYEKVLGKSLPDHYSLYGVCGG